jgi:uncharacterized protein
MMLVLSPAKALDFDSPICAVEPTQARHLAQAAELVGVLKAYSAPDVARLMGLSDALSALNVARYQAWRKSHTDKNARPAILAFNGDVYEGLNARSFSVRQLQQAQDRVRILSGLYGVLRPLDRMQPYRLEMGTGLATGKGRNLYQFWGAQIAQTLRADMLVHGHAFLLNLASQEYFKAVQLKALGLPVVDCVFQEHRAGSYKVISFMAKRARGLMTRFVIENRIHDVAALKDFAEQGYVFDVRASKEQTLVFRRKVE